MTFLPIVERELRVAARRRGTFWLRVLAALIALIVGGGFWLVESVASGGGVSLGAALFSTLTWLALAGALSAGLFFTSDCLSEEKREGTLGFLFLTDLRGYDVVLGKLLATSLRCGFAFLAVFPVLAVTQLMGGVAAGLFWKTLLALTHALFFSLAAGMWVSAISRNSQTALAGTMAVMGCFLAGGPAIDGALAAARGHPFSPQLSLVSPGAVFVSAGGGGGTFWSALLTSQAVAWLMLGFGSLLIPRTWQEKAAKTSPARMRASYWWRYGGARRRTRLRRKLLNVNPVLWLAVRERWQGVAVWVMAVLMLGGFGVMFALRLQQPWWTAWNYLCGAMILLIYLWMASQASQFFAVARRTGLIELLLSTPLRPRKVAQGAWRGLVRLFARPVALILAVWFTGQVVAGAGGADALMEGKEFDRSDLVLNTIGIGMGMIVTLANLAALGWFGLWMGLTSRNAGFATLKTLIWVLVVPWFVMGVAYAMMIPLMASAILRSISYAGPGSSSASNSLLALASAAWPVLASLAKDILFITWARRKFLRDFRERATRMVAPIHAFHAQAAPPRLVPKP